MQSFIILPKRSYKFWRVFALCVAFALLPLKASNLENVNIYSNKNGLEILLLLDSAFDGSVSKSAQRDFVALTFKDLHFNKNKLQTKSTLIKNIEIFRRNDAVVVVFGEADFELKFDLNVQNGKNAIKIQVTPKGSIAGDILADSAVDSRTLQNPQNPSAFATQNLQNSQNPQNPPAFATQNPQNPQNPSLEQSISAIKSQNNLLPQNGIEGWRYVAIVGILLILIVALFVIKRRVRQNNAISPFQKSPICVAQSIQIDAKNKILIVDSPSASYILFVGATSAFIIDKIPKSEVANLIREHKIAHLLKNYEQLQKA